MLVPLWDRNSVGIALIIGLRAYRYLRRRRRRRERQRGDKSFSGCERQREIVQRGCHGWLGSPVEIALSVGRKLGQPVVDLVVVALIGHEDVDAAREVRRRVEGARQHRDFGVAVAPPEQRRAAGAAKAPSGKIGSPVPAELALALDRERRGRQVRGGVVVAGLAPALGAVAIDHAAQRAAGGEAYGAA